MDESLHERLTAYLADCQEGRRILQADSEYHERQAVKAWEHRRDRDHHEHHRLSVFKAAQACAYRDVITNLERLLGVTW